MVGSQRTTALSDDIWVRDVVSVGDVSESVDAVVDILLNGIVDRTLGVARTGTVVVHAKSTTTVDILDVVAHTAQVAVVLSGLGECVLNTANLSDLTADMEVNQTYAVVQSNLVEFLQSL